MKIRFSGPQRNAMVVGLAFALIAGLAVPALAAAPESEEGKTFYYLGSGVARSLREFAITKEELVYVIQGFEDSINGEEEKLDDQTYGRRLQELQGTRREKALAAERKDAEDFVTAAAAADGARKMASGLVYSEIKAGSGDSPTPTNTVKVHYHGTLADGTVFDSSVERGEPAEFPLNRVIPCWTEGVGMMKIGGKAKLICPPDIAYGDRGAPPAIPAGAALSFEVELIEIMPAK